MSPEQSGNEQPTPSSPVRRAIYARRLMGILTLLALLICIVNLPDGSRWQLEATGAFMLSLVLYVMTLCWVWGARVEQRIRDRR